MPRARLFLALLLALIVVAGGILFQRLLAGKDLTIIAATLAGLLIIYAIGRFLSYRLSRWLMIGLLLVEMPVIIWMGNGLTFVILLLVLTLLIAVMLLSVRSALLITVVEIGLILLLGPAIFQENTSGVSLPVLLTLTILISSLILVIAWLREQDLARLEAGAQTLKDNEERLRLLLEESPEMIAVQAGSRFLYINATGVRLLGADSAAAIIGQETRRFLLEDGRGSLNSSLRRSGSSETLTVTFEQMIQRLDGTRLPTSITASSITYAGQLASLLIVRENPSPPAREPAVAAVAAAVAVAPVVTPDTLVNQLPVAMLLTVGEAIRFANHQMELLTGYRLAELQQMSPAVLLEAAPAGTAGRPDDDEPVLLRHRNGTRYLMQRKTQPIPHQGQTVLLHTFIDIGPYWHREQRLALLEQAVAQQQEAILITDALLDQGPTIEYVNAAMCRMSGYSEAELIGSTPRMLQGALTGQQILIELRRALQSGATFSGENVNYRKDGTPYHVRWDISPLRNSAGVITHFVSTQRDITEQRRLLDDVQTREEKYRIISDIMSDYAYLMDVDADGTMHVRWLTGAFEAMTGYTRDEMRDMHSWEDIVYPEDLPLVQYLFRREVLQGKTTPLEFRIKLKQPPYFRWVRHSLRPVYDEAAGRVTRLYGAAQDISERIQAEQLLKEHILQQSIVVELGLLAFSELPLPQLLEQGMMLCQHILESDSGEMVLYDAAAGDLRLAYTTLSDALIDTRLPAEPHHSPAGYTLLRRDTVIFNLAEVPAPGFTLPEYLRQAGVVAGLCVPIHTATNPGGVLSLYSHRPRTFTEDDSYFMQSVANVLAATLERNRVLAAGQEERDFSDAVRTMTDMLNSNMDLKQVLDKVLEFCARHIPGHEASTIMLLDETQTHVTFATSRGYDDYHALFEGMRLSLTDMPITRKMLQDGQPVLVADTEHDPLWNTDVIVPWHIRSYLGAPIRLNDLIIGVINIDSFRPNAFKESDAPRLLTFAAKAAAAIQNARRAEDLERRVIERTRELTIRSAQLQAILRSTGEGILYSEGLRIIFVNQAL
ncbi:MAG: PAS domain S-box protein, partial [Anaerolineae bacterium]|nr:PAS domain S-box protein [Anaerolineae bacterium]